MSITDPERTIGAAQRPDLRLRNGSSITHHGSIPGLGLIILFCVYNRNILVQTGSLRPFATANLSWLLRQLTRSRRVRRPRLVSTDATIPIPPHVLKQGRQLHVREGRSRLSCIQTKSGKPTEADDINNNSTCVIMGTAEESDFDEDRGTIRVWREKNYCQ